MRLLAADDVAGVNELELLQLILLCEPRMTSGRRGAMHYVASDKSGGLDFTLGIDPRDMGEGTEITV